MGLLRGRCLARRTKTCDRLLCSLNCPSSSSPAQLAPTLLRRRSCATSCADAMHHYRIPSCCSSPAQPGPPPEKEQLCSLLAHF